MGKHITAANVVDGIYELARLRPGVYENRAKSVSCINKEADENGKEVGSCIVGSFLIDVAGIPSVEVPRYGSCREVLGGLEDRGHTFEPEAKALLGMAQLMQDGRKIDWATIASLMSNFEHIIGGLGNSK